MQLRIRDVERVKAAVRKMAAGHVLAGDTAAASLDLGPVEGCSVCIAAGYGVNNPQLDVQPRDRLLWVLEGSVEIHGQDGHVTHASKGESTVLAGGAAYRLVFPQLALYLSVEAESGSQHARARSPRTC